MTEDRHQEFLRRYAEAERRIAEGGDPMEELAAIAETTVASLTADQRANVERNLSEKDVPRRLIEFTEVMNEILQGERPVVAGETIEQRAAQFEQLVEHARALWRDAVAMFERRRFGTATFLAIACMEEVGKGGVARFQVLVGLPAPERSTPIKGAGKRRRKSALYSHPQKHVLVAAQGALINSRLDHLLGFDRMKQFVNDVEAGEIERLRQASLYADHDGTQLLLPENRISEEEALFHVILAGELLAEVLGFGPEMWEELLTEVKQFEEAHGYIRE